MALKVLLVEDNPQNRYLVTFLLERSGYEVVPVEDGERAIEAVEAYLPDVILMDVQLPRMDGIEATRRIKADDRFRHIPVIALTAHSMKSDRARAIEAGCDDYITKPVDTEHLLELLQRLQR